MPGSCPEDTFDATGYGYMMMLYCPEGQKVESDSNGCQKCVKDLNYDPDSAQGVLQPQPVLYAM